MKRAVHYQRYFHIVVCLAVAGILTLLSLPGPAGAGVLYHNGPVINSWRTSVGGANEFVRQESLGLTWAGSSVQHAYDWSVADDFVISDPSGAHIAAVTFFAFEDTTIMSIPSVTGTTITGVYYQIWNGPPNAGGSVIYGDLTTNRLANLTWSGVYCCHENTTGDDTTERIMLIRAAADVNLAPGTYWIEWEISSTDLESEGPWANFVTVNGLKTTGNALESWMDGSTKMWEDSEQPDGSPQGIAFILHSTYEYYIPYYARGVENTYTSLALRNSSAGEASEVLVTYYALNGTQVATETRTIPASGEDAFVVGSGTEGWILVSSDQPLTGLCWVGAIDGAWPWIMADITLIPNLAFELIVPHVAQKTGQWDTSVYVCNPHPTATTVTLQYVEANGTVSASYRQTYALPANGAREIELDAILPAGQQRERGSVRISATQGVAAYALYYDIAQVAGGSCFAGISAVNPNAIGD